MAISSVIILIAATLLVRASLRTHYGHWTLLVACILGVYWLQPALPVRNLDFWLPTLTIAIAVLGWVATTPADESRLPDNLPALALVAAIIVVVGLTRYLGMDPLLTASRPPPFWQVAVALVVAAPIVGGSIRLHPSSGLVVAGMSGLVGLLILLKTPFLTEAASLAMRGLSGQNTSLASALDIRWLGFSYVAFRIFHTLRDRLAGRLPAVNLREYLSFVIFYPALPAGPIDRLERFQRDLAQKSALDTSGLIEGGRRLVIGLFKKFVLADTLGLIALSPSNASLVNSTGWTWVLLYAFALQIWLDFSGYTDIAIGLGRWLGIRLPENFNNPYVKSNLTSFWNSWHMSLTQWFRSYFFNPLTRRLRAREKPLPVAAIVLVAQVGTMLLIGLWHGVSWNFALWGAWHGLGMFVQNRWSEWMRGWQGDKTIDPRISTALRGLGVVLTFHYVTLGWVWFVLPKPPQALVVLSKLMGLD